MKILVTGGTGTLGRKFEEIALEQGLDIRLASRNRPKDLKSDWCFLDLETGKGLDEALKDVDVIFHAATSPVRKFHEVDYLGTKRLLAACKENKIKHLIYPSIVGIDEIPMKYYKCKLQVESIIKSSGVPFTILRATQFHNLIDSLFNIFLRYPITILPTKMKFQTIAVEEVAAAFVNLCNDKPLGCLPDIGGPEIMTVKEMHRIWRDSKGKGNKLVPLFLPLPVIKGFVKGYNTNSEIKSGKISWKDWLAGNSGNKIGI